MTSAPKRPQVTAHRASERGAAHGAAIPVEYAPHALALVLTLLALGDLPPTLGLVTILFTSMTFACWISLKRGGAYFLPSSGFMLASGVFIGAAIFYLLQRDRSVSLLTLRDAAGLAMLSTLGVSATTIAISNHWRLRWTKHPEATTDPRRRFRSPKHFEVKALALVGLSQVPPIEATLGPIATGAGLGGVLMITLSAASKRRRLRWYGDALTVAIAFLVPVLWMELVFVGGGRLTLAGLAIASFVGWNLIRPHRMQKALVILSIPVFLAFAGLNRADDGTSTGSVVAKGDGLGSVYSPLQTWARIIEPKPDNEAAKLGPRYGETFFNSLVLPIPRAIWEDKPIGFGAELTAVLEPQLAHTTHSMAALTQGEWYANFGYLGLVIMIPITGWFLAMLDRTHYRLVQSQLGTTSAWWAAVALLCMCASLGDLYWVGTFTYFSRGGIAALVIWGVGKLSTGRHLTASTTGRGYVYGSVEARQ